MWYAWKQLHLFRYVISYQQAKYIVDNYKGRTDEEKLINYIVKEKIWNWTAEESTRLHLKSYNKGEQYPDGHSYANGGVNLKVVTNARFRSEFIINGDGKFLTLLDEHATQDAKVNCSSFNYARRNDYIHTVLDVNPAKPKYNYEPKFRNDAYLVRDNNGDIIKGKEFISPKHINTEDELGKCVKKHLIMRCYHGKNKQQRKSKVRCCNDNYNWLFCSSIKSINYRSSIYR